MINLLPEKEKKYIQKEYVLRVVGVFLSGFTASIITGAILLSPSYFLSRAKENEIEYRFAIMQESEEVSEEAEIKKAFSETMEKLSALDTQIQTPLYEIFSAVLLHKPDGVVLEGMELKRGAQGDSSSVEIAGTALTRDDLLSFSRILEESEFFTEVVLPVSNLAHDRDISFTLDLIGSF